MSWLQRVRQRHYDLAHGADADLVRENRKRFFHSAVLICTAALLLWIATKLPLPHFARLGAAVLAILCFLVGVVLFYWACAEHRFLDKPDPEPPPSIFQD